MSNFSWSDFNNLLNKLAQKANDLNIRGKHLIEQSDACLSENKEITSNMHDLIIGLHNGEQWAIDKMKELGKLK